MAKRKSITGIKKKKPANRIPGPEPHSLSPSAEAPEGRAGSIALGPDVIPGKRTLLSIQDSRRRVQLNRVDKSGPRTYPKGSLKPTLKHVSQNIIQSKWKVLDEAAQAKVEDLFRSVGLPVLAKHTKEASKVEAQDAIALVTRSLCKRLPKMPFPSTTKIGHFDYDEMAKNSRELRQRLKGAADSIESSKAELEKQKLQLKIERKQLRQLESNLEIREDQSAVIPPLDQNSRREDTPTAIGLVSVAAG